MEAGGFANAVDHARAKAYSAARVQRSWLVTFALGWLVAGSASAQLSPPRELREPGTIVAPSPPPAIGACLGGDCRGAPARERAPEPPRPPLGNLAYAGAIFGTVSAGLVLGGATAIAVVDDAASERVTRGLWLGYLGVATPLVALSAHLGRRGSRFRASPTVRRLGWGAYAAAMTDGVLLWSGTFRDFSAPRGLTIAAGAIGALALLPHALDALLSARNAQMQRFRARLSPSPSGLAVSF